MEVVFCNFIGIVVVSVVERLVVRVFSCGFGIVLVF